jgi:hypothetical protein
MLRIDLEVSPRLETLHCCSKLPKMEDLRLAELLEVVI